MIDWIVQNPGTVVIGLVVAGIVTAIVVKIVRDKQKGKCVGCDCRRGDCPRSKKCCTAIRKNIEKGKTI